MLGRKGAAVTYLGEETFLEGVFKAKGKVRLDGGIKGLVQVEGELEVGPTGRVEGERVEAQSLLVHGEVRAEILAQKVVLAKTARVYGDITTETLDIEAGARFVGQSRTMDKVGPALPVPQEEA
ncbi:MAG: bactofilin family protein [Thermaceae bacterium]